MLSPLWAALWWLSLLFLEPVLATGARLATWDPESWTLSHGEKPPHHGDHRQRLSMANGYIGISSAGVGPFWERSEGNPEADEAHDEQSGWPLRNPRQAFATIAGFYGTCPVTTRSNFEWLQQYGSESVISGIPHWAGLYVEQSGVASDRSILNGSVSLDDIHNFWTSFNIRGAQMHWGYRWAPPGGVPILVNYTMFVNKLFVNKAAVQLSLNAERDVKVTVYDVLEGDCAVRSTLAGKGIEDGHPTIWSAVNAQGVNATAFVYSTLSVHGLDAGPEQPNNASTIAQSIPVTLNQERTVQVEKFIGAASSDAFPDDPQSTARDASIDGAEAGFAALLASHQREWSTILHNDSVDRYFPPNETTPANEYLQLLNITAVTNPFYILQNTVGPNAVKEAGGNLALLDNSISVCGLGSDCYAGYIMWDAEVWMLTGLLASHPESLRQVTQYRSKQFQQAKDNVKMANTSSKANTTFRSTAAVYPWTGSRWGNCTANGPCFDYEYHVNGGIGLAIYDELVVTGDVQYFEDVSLPIYNAIADFYTDLISCNETACRITNATDPDEYENFKDQPAFTTELVKAHLKEAKELNSLPGIVGHYNPAWDEKWPKMTTAKHNIGNHSQLVLVHDTYDGTVVKQADVVLIDDLMHVHTNCSLCSFNYYADKQDPDGPGMTFSSFSVVANDISPSGCSSFTYDVYSKEPYVRGPWYQFSEQIRDGVHSRERTRPAFPFLTGMGGAHRVALFGYLGLKFDLSHLEVDPALPPQIGRLEYRTFYWQGHGIRASSNRTWTTLERLPASSSLPHANETYRTSPIPVQWPERGNNLDYEILQMNHHDLTWTEHLSILHRLPSRNKTIAGNMLQCIDTVQSDAHHVGGQYPFAAIDGAVSTKWEPIFENATASITVELAREPVQIGAVIVDWGSRPAEDAILRLWNDPKDWKNDSKAEFHGLRITHPIPFNVSEVGEIVAYRSNVTHLCLPVPLQKHRFASLVLKGCSLEDCSHWVGPTVAEWALFTECNL